MSKFRVYLRINGKLDEVYADAEGLYELSRQISRRFKHAEIVKVVLL